MENVELFNRKLAAWPAVPSTSIKPILFAVPIVTVPVPPRVIRPVKATFATVYGGGGTKKSAVLVAFPIPFETVM